MTDLTKGELPGVVGGIGHPDVEIVTGAIAVNLQLQGGWVTGNAQSGCRLEDNIVAIAGGRREGVLQFSRKDAFCHLCF